MAQTPYTAAESYCTPTKAMVFYARSLWANMLRATPDAPNPSYLAMIDPANPANQKFQTYLNKGAGEIEAYCAVAKRYTPDDLDALTGVSRDLLDGLNAARGLWAAYTFLKPGTAKLDECPGAKESWDMLQELRDGVAIFGFIESQEAGLPSVQPANPNALITPNVVSRARRLFPNYGLNSYPYADG